MFAITAQSQLGCGRGKQLKFECLSVSLKYWQAIIIIDIIFDEELE